MREKIILFPFLIWFFIFSCCINGMGKNEQVYVPPFLVLNSRADFLCELQRDKEGTLFLKGWVSVEMLNKAYEEFHKCIESKADWQSIIIFITRCLWEITEQKNLCDDQRDKFVALKILKEMANGKLSLLFFLIDYFRIVPLTQVKKKWTNLIASK